MGLVLINPERKKMFTSIVIKARRFANKPIMRTLFKMRIVESLARNLQSLLMRLSYAEIAKIISNGPIELTVGDIAVIVQFPNNSSYFSFFDSDSNETAFIAYILGHSERASVIYDIGANIGVFSLFFGKHAKEVIAFEPFPNNCIALRENIKRNSLDNVRICCTAVSDKNGRAQLYFPEYADNDTSTTALASLGKVDTPTGVRVTDVAVATIDKAIDEYGLPLPDVIKIDIEGAEYAALVGMQQTLKKSRASLFIEIHPSQIMALGASECELYDLLLEYGYSYKEIKESARWGGSKKIHAWFSG